MEEMGLWYREVCQWGRGRPGWQWLERATRESEFHSSSDCINVGDL